MAHPQQKSFQRLQDFLKLRLEKMLKKHLLEIKYYT